MAKQKTLSFRPYVGKMFKFNERMGGRPAVGKRIYSNYIMDFVQLNPLPEAFLVVDEKQNFVKFLGPGPAYFWARKTQIDPASLPTIPDDPRPTIELINDFLRYCTETKICQFKVEEMSSKALELIPILQSLAESLQKK